MKNGWDKFWDFIGAAFWVVLIGWGAVALFTPKDSSDASSSDSTTNTRSYTSEDNYDSTDYSSYDSYDSYDSSSDYNTEYDSDSSDSSDYRSTYNSSYDMDCGDFDSWDDAQYYYENVADDNLDGDGDGVACESLN